MRPVLGKNDLHGIVTVGSHPDYGTSYQRTRTVSHYDTYEEDRFLTIGKYKVTVTGGKRDVNGFSKQKIYEYCAHASVVLRQLPQHFVNEIVSASEPVPGRIFWNMVLLAPPTSSFDSLFKAGKHMKKLVLYHPSPCRWVWAGLSYNQSGEELLDTILRPPETGSASATHQGMHTVLERNDLDGIVKADPHSVYGTTYQHTRTVLHSDTYKRD